MTADSATGKVRVRFPPSPTGPVHVGNIRTAIYNWLFAKKHGDVFVFRIEDTDKERSEKEYEDQIVEALKWLGLDWDEGPGKEKGSMRYRQSERTDAYRANLELLLKNGGAYWCYCTKEELEAQKQIQIAEGKPQVYEGHCRNLTSPPKGKNSQVIRLKAPEGIVEFRDMIRGTIKTDTALLGDFVIAKSLDEPLYHLAVVVDDHDMNITHVIRGEDHISNTPKQILIARALGFQEPRYAHLPLILNADRSKLSKRNADVALLHYRDRGFLPEAILNFLVLLGWHPKDDQEVFTLADVVPEFDLARVQKGGAIWNNEKLLWLNREHLKRLTTDALALRLAPYLPPEARKADTRFLHGVIDATRDRMKVLADFKDLADFFFALPEYQLELLVWNKENPAETADVLREIAAVFKKNDATTKEQLEKGLEPLIAKYGKGNALWPLRAALSGKTASPDPYTIAAILGQKEVLARISRAIEKAEILKND